MLATFAFYALNGWWVEATQDEVIDLAVGSAAGELTVEDIEKRLAEWASPLTGDGRESVTGEEGR